MEECDCRNIRERRGRRRRERGVMVVTKTIGVDDDDDDDDEASTTSAIILMPRVMAMGGENKPLCKTMLGFIQFSNADG